MRPETAEAVSIAFSVPPELRTAYRFAHGQYLTLRAVLAGNEVRRSYSICSGLDDGEMRIAIKRVDGGVFSGFATRGVRSGDVLDAMTPMGHFTTPLKPEAARLHIALVCGSGITPVLSIIKTILSREPLSRFTLLYGNRTSRSIMFKDTLEDLKDRFLGRLSVHHVLSRESQDIAIFHGRLDAEKIRKLMQTVAERTVDHAFLCGPEAMIDEARSTLVGLGIISERIHAELFTPSSPALANTALIPQQSAAPGALAVIKFEGATHRIVVAPGQTIVEAAGNAGLELPYSCKGGMCCTCRARLTSGAVRMDQNYSLEPWEMDRGFVLTCQSHPTSPSVSLDFDQV